MNKAGLIPALLFLPCWLEPSELPFDSGADLAQNQYGLFPTQLPGGW